MTNRSESQTNHHLQAQAEQQAAERVRWAAVLAKPTQPKES